MVQPIRPLRCSICACGARETSAKVTPRALRWASSLTWSVNIEQPPHGSPSGGNQKWCISRKVLAERLKHLVDAGMLERRPYSEQPLRHEYVLTEMGSEFVDALMAMVRWGDRWTAGDAGPPVLSRHRACGSTSIQSPREAAMLGVSNLGVRADQPDPGENDGDAVRPACARPPARARAARCAGSFP
jgi:HxlR-like helix-turn-helix protein